MRLSPNSSYSNPPCGPSQHKPSHGQAPKFGWGWDAHNTIESVSIHWLPDSSYKGFLQRHLPEINRVSVQQDKEHEGPQHYLNLEDMDQPPISKDASHDFNRVCQQFSPQSQTLQREKFRQAPLSTERLAGFTNVFQTTTQLYDRLVGLLKMAPYAPNQAQLSGQITETVGALGHYTADLNQPLHTTRHSTWDTTLQSPSEPGAKGVGSHHFMEVDLFSKAENRDLGNAMASLNYQPTYLPFAGLKQRLLTQLQNAYLQVYGLVQGDAQARKTGNAYSANLKQAWKPIATQQTVASACTVSDILHSAYEDAGRPDLSQL